MKFGGYREDKLEQFLTIHLDGTQKYNCTFRFLSKPPTQPQLKLGILASWLPANVKFGSQFWLGQRH